MSEINLGWYDVTQLDWIADLNDLAIPQSGAWKPLVPLFKRARFDIDENRIEYRGNQQTIQIDKRVKQNGVFEVDLEMFKYDVGPPIWDWWDIVKQGFYNTAAEPVGPALRPSTFTLGAKLNRPTPEYWTALANKIEQVKVAGSFTEGDATLSLIGIARKITNNTTNYIQAPATRNTDPVKTPIVPASDITILLDGTDRTTELQDFTLTLTRTYKKAGRDTSDGMLYREFIPIEFDGRLECKQDPLRAEHLTKYLADTAITCEIKIQNNTKGKKIQFTAAKHRGSKQEYSEGEAPSSLDLDIVAGTFSVDTLL